MTVERSQLYNGTTMLLHYHNGSTCHGSPSAQDCADEAMKNGWTGKILERVDTFRGKTVKCYSLIACEFDHWAKHGRFVAVIEPTVRKLDSLQSFQAAGGHSPEIRERTSVYQGTVTPIRVFVEGDNLVQEFEYIDGPNKGERFKTTTKKG